MEGISVIICTKNSEDRIVITLKHLLNQSFISKIAWEVLIIDNGSTDTTYLTANNYLASNNNQVLWSIYKETKPGKTNALLLGINKSKFDYILICDDDNWLSSNYLEISYNIFKYDIEKEIGIIGGTGYPVNENNEQLIYPGKLGGTDLQYHRFGLISKPSFAFYGAGSVIRKEIFTKMNNLNLRILVNGLSGKKAAGEDYEICYISTLLGYKFFYSKELSFNHFYSAGRLQSSGTYLDDISYPGTKFFIKFYHLLLNKKINKLYLLIFYPFLEIYSSFSLIINEWKKYQKLHKGVKKRFFNSIKFFPYYYINLMYFNRLINLYKKIKD